MYNAPGAFGYNPSGWSLNFAYRQYEHMRRSTGRVKNRDPVTWTLGFGKHIHLIKVHPLENVATPTLPGCKVSSATIHFLYQVGNHLLQFCVPTFQLSNIGFNLPAEAVR